MNARNSQRGITLLVSLIMLVVLTLFALSIINLSNINLRIAGNMEMKRETESVAQRGVDDVLKSAQMTISGGTITVGNASYTPTVTKECVDSKVSAESDPTVKVYDSIWVVKAEVSDSRSGAKSVVQQGVSWSAGGACP